MVKVGVIGASGYTGVELLRLIAGHPDLDLGLATADTNAGALAAAVTPSLVDAYPDLELEPLDVDRVNAAALDVAFLASRIAAALDLVPDWSTSSVASSTCRRLSGCATPSAYPRWYGFEHDRPELLRRAVYGFRSGPRAALPGAALIATPGCYVTAATLALAPLLDGGLLECSGHHRRRRQRRIRSRPRASEGTAFCTVDENFVAYGLLDHRHTPEIEQNIDAEVLFTPHLVPMNRGILATCYARPASGAELSTELLLEELAKAFRDEPFVVVTADSPSTKATLGSNTALVTARFDARTGYAVVLCAIDNLTKGASGGAVQAANVALGLDETAGLPRIGLMP